ASGGPLVVIMQPTYDRTSNYLVACTLRGRNQSDLFWNLLPNPLMRPRLVEVDHIRASARAGAASPAGSEDGPDTLAAHSS
ncbi:MAG TPA: hypothetical protein VF043_07025, partial [Ktedonobacteraceae bacterium]